jgi:pyruvate formate lyase activating enzyme
MDLFLFDLKIADPARHTALTGVDNRDILTNLRYLADARPQDVVVRFAVVPGYTDDDANLDGIASLMRAMGLRRLDLEPYHPLGAEKYESIGRAWRCAADPGAIDAARMRALAARFAGQGLTVGLA